MGVVNYELRPPLDLVRITPSNNPGTERELLPNMVGNFLVLPQMSWAQAGETDLIQRIDAMKSSYYHPYEYFW